MRETPTPAYGSTRSRRASVSYAEIERAATAILKSGKRPTIESVREAVGGGSPETITQALERYWRDLGTRIEGDPAALLRLPAEVADLADGIWRRALDLAAQAASQREGADQERLERFRRENELRAHALSLREKELDALLRTRERTVEELETHLRTSMTFVANAQESVRSLETRLAAAQAETDIYRLRLAKIVIRAVTKQRSKNASKPSHTARDRPSRKPNRRSLSTAKTRPQHGRRRHGR